MKRQIALVLCAALLVTGLPAAPLTAMAAEETEVIYEAEVNSETEEISDSVIVSEDEIPESGPDGIDSDRFGFSASDDMQDGGVQDDGVMTEETEDAYDGSEWLVQEENANPETISRETKETYVEDGTWADRLAFMERLRAEQQELSSQLITGIAGTDADGDSVDADNAAEAVTGISKITPAEGDVNTLFVSIEFKDFKFSDGYRDSLDKIFKDDDQNSSKDDYYPLESMTAYYQRSSDNKLHLSGEIFNFKSDQDRSFYDDATLSNKLLNNDVAEYLIDEILKADETDATDNEKLNAYMSKFDLDKDYVVDGAYFLYAGPHTGWGSQWWSYRYNPNIKIGDYSLTNIVMVAAAGSVAEDAYDPQKDDKNQTRYHYLIEHWGDSMAKDPRQSVDTFIHETGHMLGLDDYYAYGAEEGAGSGCRDMMNDAIGDHNAYSKLLLGWKDKSAIEWITAGTKVTLPVYGTSSEAAFITTPGEHDLHKDDNPLYSQFIMVQNVKNVGNDTHYVDENGTKKPDVNGEGFRIVHVYGNLNESKTGYAGSNPDSSMIPVYRGYNVGYVYKTDGERETEETTPVDPNLVVSDPSGKKDYYVFGAGDELKAEHTWFYYDPSNGGTCANSLKDHTGISLTDFNTEAGTFKVGFDDGDYKRPDFSTDIEYDQNKTNEKNDGYFYFTAAFDTPVVINDSFAAEIYEVDSEGYVGKKVADADIFEIIDEAATPDVMLAGAGSDSEANADETVKYGTKVNIGVNQQTLYGKKYCLKVPKGMVSTEKGSINNDLYPTLTDKTQDSDKYVPSPIFGAEGKIYAEPLKVTLTLPVENPNYKIYYTLDGTAPDPGNADTTKEYVSAIDVNESKIITAMAYDVTEGEGRKYPSEVVSEEYFIESYAPAYEELTIAVGEATYVAGTRNPDNLPLTYTSSDPEIVTVINENSGEICGMRIGDAVITITTPGKAESNVTVHVVAESDGLRAVRDANPNGDVTEIIGSIVDDFGSDTILTAADIKEKVTVKNADGSETTKVWASVIPDQQYTGAALKPEVRVYDGLTLLSAGTDYKVTYKNNKKINDAESAAKAEATITMLGNYKSIKLDPVKFTIKPFELDYNTMEIMPVTVKANAKNSKPKPVVYVTATGKKITLSAKQFEVTYYESKNPIDSIEDPGVTKIASITPNKDMYYKGVITAIGDLYEGAAYFEVFVQGTAATEGLRNILDARIKLSGTSFTYSGLAIKPEVTVTKSKSMLAEDAKKGQNVSAAAVCDVDYEVSYKNFENPGKACVIVSGKGNYYGSKILFYTIKNGKSIKSDVIRQYSDVVVDNKIHAAYSQAGAKPEITLKDMMTGQMLTEGTDYKISYKSNKKTGKTGYAVVTGKGLYKGTRKIEFVVDKCELTNDRVISYDIFDFVKKEGATPAPGVLISDNGKKLTEGRDYEVKVSETPRADTENTYEVTITGIGDNYAGTISKWYSVIDKEQDVAELATGTPSGTYYYSTSKVELTDADLSKVVPTLTLRKKTADGSEPTEDGFFVDHYENNDQVGTATAVIRGCGKYGGLHEVKFEIQPKSEKDVVADADREANTVSDTDVQP